MNGIINVYKEKGWTSFDVVAKLRGMFHERRIGHTGTLDPEAQGVLPVCIGKATKVCDLLTDKSKTYRTVLLLGISTDTQDLTGNVLAEKEVPCTKDEVKSCLESFVGELEQVPPMYSALKVEGKRLYDLAREGKEIERKPRKITIEELTIERIDLPEVQMIVRCSRGTYIRTLCSDIGEKLGCGGCMKSLLRTQSGPFLIKDSKTIPQIEQLYEEGKIEEILLPVDSLFSQMKAVYLTERAERLVRNGNPIPAALFGECLNSDGKDSVPDRGRVRLYADDGTFLAVYEYAPSRQNWHAYKMFI